MGASGSIVWPSKNQFGSSTGSWPTVRTRRAS
jgi:hypothetical protein